MNNKFNFELSPSRICQRAGEVKCFAFCSSVFKSIRCLFHNDAFFIYFLFVKLNVEIQKAESETIICCITKKSQRQKGFDDEKCTRAWSKVRYCLYLYHVGSYNRNKWAFRQVWSESFYHELFVHVVSIKHFVIVSSLKWGSRYCIIQSLFQ